MTESKNIYEKLQTIRVELQKAELKKSGRNEYAKYEYYELSDFMPKLNELMAKEKLTSRITFDTERAELALIDIENPTEQIIFQAQMVMAGMKGSQAIQQLGATITYLRRYLYMTAFEIVEADAVDKSKPENGQVKMCDETQRKTIFALGDKLGKTSDVTKNWAKDAFGLESFSELTYTMAEKVIKKLQKEMDGLEVNKPAQENTEYEPPTPSDGKEAKVFVGTEEPKKSDEVDVDSIPF